MKQNIINGLSLMGIAMTAIGLFPNADGNWKWFFAASALLLVVMGLAELSSKDKQ